MSSQKNSAGILLYKIENRKLHVLLVHPGGPFWQKKDSGAWSVPKGEYEQEEEALNAAIREMKEETGLDVSGNVIELSPVKQKSGKRVRCWAVEGDFDLARFRSNTFEMEWPPRSGKKRSFPEVDRAEWFELEEAAKKINPGQKPLLDDLEKLQIRKK